MFEKFYKKKILVNTNTKIDKNQKGRNFKFGQKCRQTDRRTDIFNAKITKGRPSASLQSSKLDDPSGLLSGVLTFFSWFMLVGVFYF